MAGILHVCTANLIRSPIAELLTRQYLPDTYTIGSAGLDGVDGRGLPAPVLDVLRHRGVDGRDFTSRRFVPELAAAANLVLTATRRHRDAILAAQPYLLRRVFTWRELAWLVGGLAPDALPGDTVSERVYTLAAVAASRRGQAPAPPGAAFDIRDPVDGPPGAIARALDDIDAALRAFLPLVVPPQLRQFDHSADLSA